MNAPDPVRLVSVKLSPVGRSQTFLFDERAGRTVPRAGDRIIVNAENGPTVGTVTSFERSSRSGSPIKQRICS